MFAQAAAPRSAPLFLVPEIQTRIERLLATPNAPLATDHYRIDLRFGPSLRMDAIIVGALDSPARLRGLRVQVRDEGNRGRLEGT